MQLLTQISNSESSLLIFSYLNLHGKTTPAKLREQTGLSKATTFRNLALLLQAGLVEKEEDSTVADKRYRLHYYIKQNILELSKTLSTSELREHAVVSGRTETFQDWVFALENLPLALNQLTSKLMLSMRHPASKGLATECQKIIKMMAFRLEDVDDFHELLTALNGFLTEFDTRPSKKPRDWKQPLTQPVAHSISAVAPDPTEICNE
jgi:DNA-binding transcriptional ArsR family regulator